MSRNGVRRAGLLRSLWAGHLWGPMPRLLLLLTIVTGVVDAVSILALGRVFVANMTGNVVFAGFAIVGAPGFSLSASLFALAGFLIGAAYGGVLITRSAGDRGVLLRAGVTTEFALVAVSLVLAATSGAPAVTHGTNAISGAAFSSDITDALAALLAVGLGIQNAIARKLAVPDLTTTVLTMTLTGIGADLRALVGKPGREQSAAKAAHTRRLLAITAMVAGGMTSAWLVLDVSAVAALSLATALLAITTVGAALAVRHPAPWRVAASPAPVPAPAAPASSTVPDPATPHVAGS
ncbi:MAG TPA: YoaK family protein [Trebonia sp.]|nr:YoaK family protein [Trebonia sp.]